MLWQSCTCHKWNHTDYCKPMSHPPTALEAEPLETVKVPTTDAVVFASTQEAALLMS